MLPAATIGDQTICPKLTPEPHTGGQIVGPGSLTVSIGGSRAARASFSGAEREQIMEQLTIRDHDAAALIKNNAAAIFSAAEKFEIDPKILAGIVYAENWKNVDWKDSLENPLSLLMEKTPFLNYYPSIGLAQVQTRTARFLEEQGYITATSGDESGWDVPLAPLAPLVPVVPLAPLAPLSLLPFVDGPSVHIRSEQMARTKRLEDNETNLLYAAAYVRYFEDTWRSEFPQIGERADILGTLYNRGHENTTPSGSPESNEFGDAVAGSQLLMAVLLGVPCGNGDLIACKPIWIDQILIGSSTVFFDGLSAARRLDLCAHGGVIITGSETVFIGG